MTRPNCWDDRNCASKENCPAYPDHGRDCFAVSGTMCWGKQQGDYKDKIGDCRGECPFFSYLMAGS